MKREAFKAWLIEQKIYSSQKQVTDCVSRVGRAENALMEKMGSCADFDKQFTLDGGKNIKLLVSRRGTTPGMKELGHVNLPIGSNQMDSIAAAVKKYFSFCAADAQRS